MIMDSRKFHPVLGFGLVRACLAYVTRNIATRAERFNVNHERFQLAATSSLLTHVFHDTPMLLPVPLLGLVTSLLLPTLVWASALTTAISANERLCFYADVDKAGEKIGVSCY